MFRLELFPEGVVALYKAGVLTQKELFLNLMPLLTVSNACGFIRSIDTQMRDEFELYVRGCPTTDECWARFHTAGVTAEQEEERRRDHRRGVELLRDIFGPSPFPKFSPSALLWKDGCLVKLATTIQRELNFSVENMSIVGDALEESGLGTEEMLLHCRQAGLIHLSDCWLFQLLMGKK